ncbi:MAG: pimeloyl-CoA dehydrogenase small subunit, partial [Candidatus Rokuibacteriota bacterium]
MDFEYSDEQRLFSETLRKFLNTGYGFDARAKIITSSAGFSEDVWAAMAEMGILGVPFDAEHGGFGGNTVDMMVVMEALGEALVVEPYLATVGLGGRFIARGGTVAQQKQILPSVIAGKTKMAFAQTEPGARYELARVSARATPSGDGWVLEGDKRAVLHGGCADLLVVSARTAGAEGDAHGISVFLVERGAPGVTVSEYRGLDNLRLADVRLSGVRVARAGLLGAEGGGWSLIE